MRRLHAMLFALMAALALSAVDARAQTIGFKLGASLANQNYTDPDLETSGLTGFAGGGLVRFGLGRLGLQFELLTVTKGSEVDDAGSLDTKTKIEYVEIPALVHLPLTVGQSFAPYIIAGPYVAFEIGCTLENQTSGADVDCDDSGFENEKTDFGVSAGGGLAFAMGPGAIVLEGRYSWGMKNLNPGTIGSEVKNRAALLLVGYEIALGRR
jgi:opacity protein-like surface antigen